MRLEHLFGDESHAHVPVLASIRFDVDREVEVEAVLVVLLKLGELLSQEDVVDGPVAKDEGQLGTVVVLEGSLDDLVAGGDTSAARDAADLGLALDRLLSYVKLSKPFVLEPTFGP